MMLGAVLGAVSVGVAFFAGIVVAEGRAALGVLLVTISAALVQAAGQV